MEENKPLNREKTEPVLILGAGASGLTLGRMLLKAGIPCLLIDKSRGLGGRIATRRFEDRFWNHGIAEIQTEDLPSQFPLEWKSFIPPSGGPATQFAKELSSPLNILKSTKINQLSYDTAAQCWKAQSEEGQIFQGKVFVSTAPLPQICEILRASELERILDPKSELSSIQYFKQLIFLTRVTQTGSPLSTFKKISAFNNDFIAFQMDFPESEELFEKEDQAIEDRVKHRLEQQGYKFSHFEIKRWRYSQCKTPLEKSFFKGPSSFPFYCAGDAFCGGGLKGALQSALELSQELIKLAPHLRSF